MVVLVLGFLILISGVLVIHYPNLVVSLKNQDPEQWKTLGSPPEVAFSQSLGVMFWVLSRGYRNSKSSDVQALGAKAFRRAVYTKYSFLLGISLIVVGFFLAVMGV